MDKDRFDKEGRFEKALIDKLKGGWELDFHTKSKPLLVFQAGGFVPFDAPYTATSPRGHKYHGNHVELSYGPYKINRGGYRPFEKELFDTVLFSEVKEAFDIFHFCNQITQERVVEILTERQKLQQPAEQRGGL